MSLFEGATTSRPASGRRVQLQRQEEALVRRRNAEHDRLRHWAGVSHYFSDWDRRLTKYNNWTSPQYYQASQARLEKEAVEKQRRVCLEERRQRLRELLEAESRQLEEEHAALAKERGRGRGWGRAPLELQEASLAAMELRRREDAARLREAELRLHQQWCRGQPVLRQWERQKQQQFVQRAWVEQVKEQQELRAKREQEEMEALHEREAKLLEEERKQEELKELKRKKAELLQQQLMEQVAVIKEKEKESEALKKQEAEAIRKQAELEELRQKRERTQEKLRNQQLRVFHRQQYQLQLRKRAREVLEQVEEDLKMLERIIAIEHEEAEEERIQKASLKLQMLRAQHQLKTQWEEEKKRFAEMELMFDEEARLMWQKQDARWRAEEQAREMLMLQVLQAVQHQLQEKLEQNLSEQRALILERENILAEVEEAHRQLQAEREEQGLSKRNYKLDIEKQLLQKQLDEVEHLQKQREAAEQEKQKIIEEEERILAEMRRLEKEAYRLPNYRRKRIIW